MVRRKLALLILLLGACGQAASVSTQPVADAAPVQTPVYSYRVVATYPHDPGAFTQGLLWFDGHLYESTGQIGQSTIRRVNLETGEVLQSVSIPPGLFGEGIVNWGDQLISVTWQSGVGYRWDRATFRRLGLWRYEGEGWGLTQNGREIIMSDGTHVLLLGDFGTGKSTHLRRRAALMARAWLEAPERHAAPVLLRLGGFAPELEALLGKQVEGLSAEALRLAVDLGMAAFAARKSSMILLM